MDSVVEDLRRVGAGLRLVSFGLVAMAVSAVAWVAVVLTLGEPSTDWAAILIGLNRNYPVAMTALLGLGVLASVLGIAGKAYCLSVPTASGATRLIVPSLACSAIGLAFWIAGKAASLAEAAMELDRMSWIFTVLGFIIFVRFLRRLAAYLGSARLLRQSRRVQVGTVVLFLIVLAASVGSAAGAVLPTIMAVFAGLLGIIFLVGLYTLLVHELRRLTEAAADYAAERQDT